jgi:hypothetical protein
MTRQQDVSMPKLSVVLVTQNDYEACRKIVGFLKEQTALADLEVVLVAPSLESLRLDEADVRVFPSFEVVEIGAVETTGAAVAAGVLAARAEWVAYCEEHSYPRPNWAEALIEAQNGPWAAVGCAMENANPGTLTSWATLLGEFGPVVAPVDSGEVSYLGGHHATYRRELLLEFGEMLDRLLEFEVALHESLRSRGHRLYLAAEAVSAHVNVSQPLAYIKSDYLGQRGFGAMRWQGQGWSWPRRLAYAAGMPLVPLLRLVRTVEHVRRCSRGRGLAPRIYPLMFVAMLAGALGEAMGYLFGAGRAAAERIDIELDRQSFVSPGERVEPQTAASDLGTSSKGGSTSSAARSAVSAHRSSGSC